MTVALPVLATMGSQCCPVPTAYLSAHTGFPASGAAVFHDMTEQIPKVTAHWRELGVSLDAVYSGFLGSAQQVDHLIDFVGHFRREGNLVLADPVMGDHGRTYRTCTPDLCRGMGELCAQADVITPNLTELYYLLDMPYQEHITDAELKQALKTLSDRGPAIVIATSVPVSGDPRSTSVYAYNRFGDRYWKVTCPYLPAHYPGTGDTFTSVITGALMQGDSLPIALDRATQFILQGIRATFGYEYNNLEGIMLEKVLHNLDMPIQISSYELVE